LARRPPERYVVKDRISRRDFIGAAAAAGAAAALGLAGCGKEEGASAGRAAATPSSAKGPSRVVIASGAAPEKMTRTAVEALGGMGKFVKRGDFVVVKPNIAWSRRPEMAATTNPDVVAAVVRMCREAGAKRVLVLDHIIDKPYELVLALTGIKAAAEAAGAEVLSAGDESMYRRIEIPKGKILTSDDVLRYVLDADALINVPIAKDHGDTRVTLGMKNLMGVIWNRQAWHKSASTHQCIADFATAVRADLTIIDANRILLENGPKGPGKTKDVGQVIAGTDIVALDAYGASLFGLKPRDVDHIAMAYDHGLGEIDLAKVKIEKV